MKSKLLILRIAPVLFLLATLVVSACSTGGGPSSGGPASTSPDEGIPGAAPGATSAAAGGGESLQPAGKTRGSLAGAPEQSSDGNSSADSSAGNPSDESEPFDRLVVQTATLALKVDVVSDSLGRAQQLATSLGGRIQSSSTRQEGKSLVADLTITVPAARFTEALSGLRKLSKEVVSESAQGQDVTEEYVDLQSRQRNLEATEKGLLTLMSRAKTVGEVLSVQRELTSVQGEIEQTKGRIKYLSTRSAMSTITLSLRPVFVPTEPRPVPAWSPFRVAEQAWNASLRVLQGLATVVIAIVVFGWWLLPPILVGLLTWRRVSRPRPNAGSSGSSAT